MITTPTPATDPAILAEQVAYYRKRAGEYDEWWFRTGRYDHGAELNTAWAGDAGEVETALVRHLDETRPQRALELACGTGLFTRWVAPRVGHLKALDASPEAQAINRARVAAANVDYALADLFAWRPAERYDFVFMSFWLSHVPDDRFDEFWAKVGAALADGGTAYVIDSGWDMTSSARNHVRPDREAGVAARKLNDGSEYRIVKIFHEPAALARRLAALGLKSRIVHTPRYFIHGAVSR
jgi:demethylmenaquinone methyltransferase/2-methoxy-6-polyprenyl-1,4-benzoquinol methylase